MILFPLETRRSSCEHGTDITPSTACKLLPCEKSMRLLDIGLILVAGYSTVSFFVGFSIIFPKPLGGDHQSWRESGGSQFADAPQAKTTRPPQISTPVSTRFFPTYGTDEFFQQCGWTSQKGDENSNCTILARPNPRTPEGISDWIPQIVSGHMIARQKACNLFFDYGDNVDIEQILLPFPAMESATHYRPINWRAPSGFECQSDKNCFCTEPDYHNGVALEKLGDKLGHLSQIPSYRFAYQGSAHYRLNASRYEELTHTLPGYKVETGMACSLASLFHLSPRASNFEPGLFSEILPTLHQDDALVMSLYIRTGRTDHLAGMEGKQDKMPAEDTARARYSAERIIHCAKHLEQKYLSERPYSRIVWMVATDSQYLKQWVPASYGGTRTNSTIDVQREVVTTHSRGSHTRATRGPSTADFAEALIDWYLIGESDLVITDTNSPSFGGTAALRTARPYYKVPMSGDPTMCALQTVVHSDKV